MCHSRAVRSWLTVASTLPFGENGGHPLYYYDDDHKAGQTGGQGVKEFGAKWYVVKPSGKKIDSD